MIVFLHCCTSNTAEEVATSFLTACNQYGVPQRVRTDHGMENFHVGVIMNILRGQNRGSLIAGQSVHNQRIERMWRDVYKEVASAFYNEFYRMEDAGILLADDPVHRCALQLAFLPVINERLGAFQSGWNSHSLRTERQQTPQQLWLGGTLDHINSSATDDIFVENEGPCQRLINYCSQQVEITPEHLLGTNNPGEWLCDDIHLTAEQVLEVKNVMFASASGEDRFLQCLGKITELL